MTVLRYFRKAIKVKRPFNLNASQKNRRFEVCQSLLRRQATEPFLNRLITCDEKWILYGSKQRSSAYDVQNEVPCPTKVMMTVWWSMAGIVHYKFLQRGVAITAETYCNQLDIVNEKLIEKQWPLMGRKGPVLLHDNARPHVARLTLQKLKQLKYDVLPHPPYSPDLSPTDYHFFPSLDKFLRDRKARTQEAIMNAFEEFIRTRNPWFYRNGIGILVSRWRRCLESNGEYFD